MKLISVAFVALLLGAHFSGAFGDAVARPLSMFRDGDLKIVGYCLFTLLVGVGMLMIRLMLELERNGDACVLIVAAVLLAAVALTPSLDLLHLMCSLVLLLLLYAYYGFLLNRFENDWLTVHMIVPVLLVYITQLHSYGVWQKSLILYFLLALNVQHHVFSTWLPDSAKQPESAGAGRKSFPRKRVVYALDTTADPRTRKKRS